MRSGQAGTGLLALRHALRGLLLALIVSLFALVPEARAQRFFLPLSGGAFSSPEALGVEPGSAPPDLDEPEIGEDPETAPLAGKAERKRPRTGPRFSGQTHESAAPLPLRDRLRRVLRDGPLGGGADFWFTRRAARDVYFVALESGTHDRYFSLGSKHAVRGDFSTPGWRGLSTLGMKLGAYDSALGTRESFVDLARLMAGYEARFGALSLSGYAGPGYAVSQSGYSAGGTRLGRFGASALAEFWFDWRDLAPRLARATSGYVLGDTANRSFALGLRHALNPGTFPFLIGPEASWSAGKDVNKAGASLHSAFRKARLGAHASEVPLFAARLRLSVGAEWKDSRKPGGYAELAAYLAY